MILTSPLSTRSRPPNTEIRAIRSATLSSVSSSFRRSAVGLSSIDELRENKQTIDEVGGAYVARKLDGFGPEPFDSRRHQPLHLSVHLQHADLIGGHLRKQQITEPIAVSHRDKARPNDADRLRKYLGRYDLSFEFVRDFRKT